MIDIHLITDRDQMAAVEQLEKCVWGISDLEVTCTHSLHALVCNGGILIGAYAAEELVGFVLGIPALIDDASLTPGGPRETLFLHGWRPPRLPGTGHWLPA
ncbi:MAG: hypothetical protein M5U34_19955 [Chloroflexi bacterium]|nr:hypothetical protein [Chloroflexota bacterium]